jgi:putative endonuclease
MAKQGFIYIMTNKNNTVLYTGVTSDLLKRVWQHKQGQHSGFTSRYNCDKLVWYELADEIRSAIVREKQLKAGSRKKKELLINEMNSGWEDLAKGWYR